MTAPFRVVAVSGSLHEPSKTTALVRAITAAVAERAEVEAQLIELTRIGPGLAGALQRDQLPPEVEAQLQAIESADLLIVGSPVYRASFTGSSSTSSTSSASTTLWARPCCWRRPAAARSMR